MMFSFGNKKNKPRLAVADLSKSEILDFTKFPLCLDENGDFGTDLEPVIKFEAQKNGKIKALPVHEGKMQGILNSASLAEAEELEPINTFQFADKLYILFSGKDALENAKKLDFSKWLVFNTESGMVEDEVSFEKIRESVERKGLTGNGLAICPKGCQSGFFYNQVYGNSATENTSPIFTNEGEIICPLCWLKFDIGDAMSIASHESLRGDPVLGAEEMLRFLPTSFDSDGIALDPAGMPSPDIACPHCRKKLPNGYLDIKRRIFSIVGAPSSGKSYYLSVLINELQRTLFKRYEMSFKDLDPSGNMLLTQMKNRLFCAEKPEDAILAKTALEGAMYERYPRFGKMVALPKPMTYSVTKIDGKSPTTAFVFYDNAGEHFEPGVDLEDSPGAMHVASSDAIFFLFDPAANRNFKRLLFDNPDPQLKIGGRIDQQDTILAEMEIRIKRIMGLTSKDKISKPLAVIIGKYDIWKDLLKEPLVPYFESENSRISVDAVNKNSDTIRNFMMGVDPSIVAGAESISTNVRYFAISSLGHSPIKLESGPHAGKIAPVPSKLNPINVEIPTLWALANIGETSEK